MGRILSEDERLTSRIGRVVEALAEVVRVAREVSDRHFVAWLGVAHRDVLDASHVPAVWDSLAPPSNSRMIPIRERRRQAGPRRRLAL
jgi:hypothetical protein